MVIKICKRCQVPKVKRSNKYVCVSCERAYHIKYKENNRELIAVQNKQYYKDNRDEILAKSKQYTSTHLEAISARGKKYYNNNRDKLLAQQKQYRENNRDAYLLWQKNHYIEHREEILEHHRQYYEDHREAVLEYSKQYYENNVDARKAANHKRRFRLKSNGGHFTAEEWRNLKLRYNNRCLACNTPEAEVTLTADHVVPLALGGGNTITNIQPLCKSCNSKKALKNTDYRNVTNRKTAA